MFDKLLRASSRVEAVASAKKIRPPAETRACSERVTPAYGWFHQTFRAIDLSCID